MVPDLGALWPAAERLLNQRSAWFLAHRLRVALTQESGLFAGPVEVDETYGRALRPARPRSPRPLEKLTIWFG